MSVAKVFIDVSSNMLANQSLQRTGDHRGCTVRAWMYARAGAEQAPSQAAELNR
jgi:hypothetical protein